MWDKMFCIAIITFCNQFISSSSLITLEFLSAILYQNLSMINITSLELCSLAYLNAYKKIFSQMQIGYHHVCSIFCLLIALSASYNLFTSLANSGQRVLISAAEQLYDHISTSKFFFAYLIFRPTLSYSDHWIDK